jgi:hypothetical protein
MKERKIIFFSLLISISQIGSPFYLRLSLHSFLKGAAPGAPVPGLVQPGVIMPNAKPAAVPGLNVSNPAVVQGFNGQPGHMVQCIALICSSFFHFLSPSSSVAL